MGDLYRAVDEVLGRPVAIKLLAKRFAADEEIRRRFRREALAAARLSGEPNTVAIFDVGEWRGAPFIVMEYLGGGTLEQALRAGVPPPDRALRWLEQTALSLDAAHARGVVHRDIKPANLLLDEQGRLRVADFGIATAAGLDSLTLTGTVLGTAGYLSPEQAQGRPVTAATDRYALAVVAYELLTGARPFAGDSATAEAAAHAHAAAPSASQRNPALPERVDEVFQRALAKDPHDRFPTCAAFVSALGSACNQLRPRTVTPVALPAPPDPPTRVSHARRRRSAVLAGSVGLLLLAGAGLAAMLLAVTGNPLHSTAAPTVTATVTKTTTVVRRPKPVTVAATSGAPAPAGVGSSANDLNTRGYELMLAGNYSAALPLLRQAVAGLVDPANPVTAYANFNLGQTLVRLGDCAGALPYLQRAAQLEPARREARDALAYAQHCAAAGPSRSAAAGSPPPMTPHGPGAHGHDNPHD